MYDRIPSPGKENRVRIRQDNGQVVEGVLEYADDATQDGSAYTKGNVLPDDVCRLLGIDPETSEPKDAFYMLSDISLWGKYFCILAFLYNGSPVSGLEVSIQGSTYTTDRWGLIKMFSTGPDLTFSVSGYADITNEQFSFICNAGEVSAFSVALQSVNYLEINTSRSVKFSPLCTRVDVCAVGAGGGGGYGGVVGTIYNGTPGTAYGGAGGGGGGGVVIKEDVSFTPNEEYDAIVGAAGRGAEYTGSPSGSEGTNGGLSSFLGVAAAGGAGGGAGGGSGGYGGSGGNGNGGGGGTGVRVNSIVQPWARNGNPGGDSTVLAFSGIDTEEQVSGGGGSGAACYNGSGTGAGGTGGAGGKGNGGNGGAAKPYENPYSGANGEFPGGGGGGCGSWVSSSAGSHGGNGAGGCVRVRMWHGEEAA